MSIQSHRVARLAGLGVSVAFLVATAGLAQADDLPLVLSNEHIGLSGSEIESAQNVAPTPAFTSAPAQAPAPEPVATEAPAPPAPSEFVSAEPGEAAPVAATETACAADAGRAVSSFEHCIEASIRGGNGFDESQRVCRVLFPEAA